MKRLLIILIALLSALVLTGCASQRPAQVVERISTDTLYVNKIAYDSIYIDNRQKVYQQADTVYLERTQYVYKYKLLRDTLYRVQIDSIPVVREVEVVREVRHIPLWAKLFSAAGAAALLLLLLRVIRLQKTKN